MYQLDGYFRSSTTRANRLLVAPFVRVGYHIAVSLSIPFVALACNLKPAVSDAVGQAVMQRPHLMHSAEFGTLYGSASIGQIDAHLPQDTHFAVSTSMR